jgi:hypothetical protein
MLFIHGLINKLLLPKQVKESEQDMNLPNLKLWVTGALLNQGFELLTASSICLALPLPSLEHMKS